MIRDVVEDGYRKPVFAREPWRNPSIQPGFISGLRLDHQPEVGLRDGEPRESGITALLLAADRVPAWMVRMARMVLDSAMLDIRMCPRSGDKAASAVRDDALAWFLGDGESTCVTCEMVCTLLGIDQSALGRAVAAIIEENERRQPRLVVVAPPLLECEHCDFTTPYRSGFRQHLKVHDVRPSRVTFFADEIRGMPKAHERALLNNPAALDDA